MAASGWGWLGGADGSQWVGLAGRGRWQSVAAGVSGVMGICWGTMGFLGGSDGKESACSVGDLGSIPGLVRSPKGGNSNPL